MRLNLGCLSETIREQGYVNIDNVPVTDENKDVYKQGSFESLDWLCEDRTVEEIVIKDGLGRISFDKLTDVIQNWAQKLQRDGVLRITMPDAHLVAQMFFQGQISLSDYQNVILATKNKNIQIQSLLDTKSLIELLEQSGLVVTVKKYDGLYVYVEAVKVRND